MELNCLGKIVDFFKLKVVSIFVPAADVSTEYLRCSARKVPCPKLEIRLISSRIFTPTIHCFWLTRAVNTDAHDTELGNHTYLFIHSEPVISLVYCGSPLPQVPLLTGVGCGSKRTLTDLHIVQFTPRIILWAIISLCCLKLECRRLIYVTNDSFITTVAKRTTPSAHYHPMRL